jgi:1-deoxy-D-xylulose-5-phosphate synthase
MWSQYSPLGNAEKIAQSQKICFLTLGNLIDLASEACKELENLDVQAGIVNMRFAKLIDQEMLRDIARNSECIARLEDHVSNGGFGSAVLEFHSDNGIKINIMRYGWPDRFIKHGQFLEI